MKVMRLAEIQPPLLLLGESPEPRLTEGEVLVQVHAAGITPTELSWYPTSHTRDGKKRVGAVPSHEFSGVIAAVADGVTGFALGDEIYGMNDWFDDGALSERCVTRPSWIAPKPRTVDHAHAAAAPIGALTAWQALFDRAKLAAGERVLVHGGAGCVGSFAIQLARWREAHVITTVSARNVDLVARLGADETIVYRATPFEQHAGEVDVVLDTVGGETLERSWKLLSKNGRMVTVASEGESATDERIRNAFFIMEPRGDQLGEIATLIDGGQLQPVVDRIVPMSAAIEVYQGTIERSGAGKTVATVP